MRYVYLTAVTLSLHTKFVHICCSDLYGEPSYDIPFISNKLAWHTHNRCKPFRIVNCGDQLRD